MSWNKISRFRIVVLMLILVATTMILLGMHSLKHIEKMYKYSMTLNLSSHVMFMHWLHEVDKFSNDTMIKTDSNNFQTNISTLNASSFLKWQSVNESYGNVDKHLMEVSDIVKLTGLNCTALYNGLGINKAKMSTKTTRPDLHLPDSTYIKLTSDCEHFRSSRGYIMSSLTQEEEDFPLAYSMLVYKELEMVERLLRAIYRPQNYYCIHVDQKASREFYNATSAVARCFPNVFIASRRISVWWGTFSVLEPELLCMQELWKYSKWKYFINLTGQEFPLKTNFELVKIFTAYRGASDVQTTFSCADRRRWRKKFRPYGIRPTTGAVHITVNRYFVDFILHNEKSKAILKWAKENRTPDEAFFPVLNANPSLGIKGTYTGSQDACTAEDRYLARYKMWRHMPCAGGRRRQICVLTIGDLPRLIVAKQLIANKFLIKWDRTVIGCLEEKIFNDTRDEYLGIKTFNTSFYSNLDFVIHQLT